MLTIKLVLTKISYEKQTKQKKKVNNAIDKNQILVLFPHTLFGCLDQESTQTHCSKQQRQHSEEGQVEYRYLHVQSQEKVRKTEQKVTSLVSKNQKAKDYKH